MSEWSRMSEDEKAKYCRTSGCEYYWDEIDDCMYPDSPAPIYNKKCEDLQKGE